jgi:hypothetical protein
MRMCDIQHEVNTTSPRHLEDAKLVMDAQTPVDATADIGAARSIPREELVWWKVSRAVNVPTRTRIRDCRRSGLSAYSSNTRLDPRVPVRERPAASTPGSHLAEIA